MQLKSFFKSSIYVLSIFIFSFFNTHAQEVVAEFGKYKVTLDEFEHAYAKLPPHLKEQKAQLAQELAGHDEEGKHG